jgi:hypothetical protein
MSLYIITQAHPLLQGAFISSIDHKENINVLDETLMHCHSEGIARKSQ